MMIFRAVAAVVDTGDGARGGRGSGGGGGGGGSRPAHRGRPLNLLSLASGSGTTTTATGSSLPRRGDVVIVPHAASATGGFVSAVHAAAGRAQGAFPILQLLQALQQQLLV